MGNSEQVDETKKKILAAQKAEQQLDQLFYNVFEGHKDGQAIMRDLSNRFYDRTSVVGSPVDANATLVNEGARNVLLYIMLRLSRFQEKK